MNKTFIFILLSGLAYLPVFSQEADTGYGVLGFEDARIIENLEVTVKKIERGKLRDSSIDIWVAQRDSNPEVQITMTLKDNFQNESTRSFSIIPLNVNESSKQVYGELIRVYDMDYSSIGSVYWVQQITFDFKEIDYSLADDDLASKTLDSKVIAKKIMENENHCFDVVIEEKETAAKAHLELCSKL